MSESEDFQFSSLEQSADRKQADTSVLSENKVEDLVEYARGNIICNESQFVLGILAKATGWIRPFETNVNYTLIGPSSGGKSHVQHAQTHILPSELAYQVSDSSNLAVVDDDEWEETLVAPLDEWQKIPDKVTEIIKSVAGEDIKYTYARNVKDDDSKSDRTTVKMHKYAKPYSFLYAQFSMDNELWNRLLKLYVDDDERIHRAIGKMHAGHDHIDVEGFENEYIYETSERATALRQYFRGLPKQYESLDGKERLVGSSYTIMPPAVWYVAEPIFNHARTETNRIYGMVFNLMRGSAILNSDHRHVVTVEEDGDEVEKVVVAPQDVVNVLAARETLLGSTHELEKRKRTIVEAVRANDGLGGGDAGCTIDRIQEYLDSDRTHVSVPKKEELREILEELSDNYIIRIRERAGPNGAHLYEFRSMKHIDVPRLTNIDELMTDDEIDETKWLWDGIDLTDPFTESTDPYRDQPFSDTVKELSDQFSDDPIERAKEMANVAEEMSAADAMGGQQTFDDEIELEEPHEIIVYERLVEHADGETFDSHVEEPHILGVIDEDVDVHEASTKGTLLDPDHDDWTVTERPDSWVSARGDAAAKIEEGYTALEEKGVIEYEQSDGGITIHVSDSVDV